MLWAAKILWNSTWRLFEASFPSQEALVLRMESELLTLVLAPDSACAFVGKGLHMSDSTMPRYECVSFGHAPRIPLPRDPEPVHSLQHKVPVPSQIGRCILRSGVGCFTELCFTRAPRGFPSQHQAGNIFLSGHAPRWSHWASRRITLAHSALTFA